MRWVGLSIGFKIVVPAQWNFSIDKEIIIAEEIDQYGKASNSLTIEIPSDTAPGNYTVRIIGAAYDGASAGIGYDEIMIQVSEKDSLPAFTMLPLLFIVLLFAARKHKSK